MWMSALGGRIKVGFDEIDKTLRVDIIFQQHPRNPKMSNVSSKTTIASKLDMFRH